MPTHGQLLLLYGPLIKTQTYCPISGDVAVRYEPVTMRPWEPLYLYRYGERLRMEALSEEPEKEYHARMKFIPVPPIEKPDWNPDDCVNQWRRWRRAEWLRKWVLAENGEDSFQAQLVVDAFDGVTM